MLHTRKLAALPLALLALISFTTKAHAQDSPASVMCKDGTTSTTTGRGACSHHGGVDKPKTSSGGTVTPAPAPASSTPPAATATTSTAATKTPASAAKTSRSENNDPTGAIAKCRMDS